MGGTPHQHPAHPIQHPHLVSADDEVGARRIDVHLEDDVVPALLHHQLLRHAVKQARSLEDS